MPLSLIQSVLGLSFVLIWAFIAAMILRDRQLAIRSEQKSDDEREASLRRTAAVPSARERVAPPGQRTRRRRRATAA
jgi:hypothetical protein